ncbi:SDR family NAD(P)-dependent oxidoreductase [Rubellicoccus peritrichatus]|uniref:SDR family NAD(P)-dependent oxidoreductase n=1 Tax=Rubellicoccus peritrichatus TaxID=3080537 RepID=A0AAQ3LE88_9BACT|nr:SDR family NAD(P)-dependent oxidoreductase [Puniceicoccus sp. CR14]WOO42909.1 SDR family NAD(P)-dependent oxidoreductase [Puniceicoccus sp. CR14]
MHYYLVTGAAGFIGSETSRMLLERGDSVLGLDSMNNYYDVRLKEHRLESLKRYPAFSFIEAEVEDAEKVHAIFQNSERFTAVYHLAARAGVRYSVARPDLYAASNLCGVINVMESMRSHDVQKIVLASTSSLYADERMPFNEEAATNKPRSPYAASKKAAETMAYAYHHLHGLDISILRYFTVYGPAGRPDMAPLRFVRWIDEGHPITMYGDGTQGRDFTYVSDIARGTVLAEKKLGYEIINLGHGTQPVELREFISVIEDILGKKAVIDEKPFIAADMKDTWADITKAKSLLDWEPKVKLYAGLEKTVSWYRDNYYWIKEVKF